MRSIFLLPPQPTTTTTPHYPALLNFFKAIKNMLNSVWALKKIINNSVLYTHTHIIYYIQLFILFFFQLIFNKVSITIIYLRREKKKVSVFILHTCALQSGWQINIDIKKKIVYNVKKINKRKSSYNNSAGFCLLYDNDKGDDGRKRGGISIFCYTFNKYTIKLYNMNCLINTI